MKLLRITTQNFPLFKENLDLSFYATQRVADEEKELLYPLFSNIYLNCAQAFIGINASGKTSVLKVVLFALNLLNSQPINYIESRDILGNAKNAIITIYFYSDAQEICKLETIINKKETNTDEIRYVITNETMWTKPITVVETRKKLIDFSGIPSFLVRSEKEEFLSDDVSIVISHNKKHHESINVISLLSHTNSNVLPVSEKIPLEIISFLDPTIECLYFEKTDKKTIIHLKFIGSEEIILNNPIELNHYLSSGTIKGIVIFSLVSEVLDNGGYLVVDEIENHFNKEIVTTLIRFFMDGKLNKNGGTIIFSTHYPELLDTYDRNDSIYITKNTNGIIVEKLCNILKRNDIKKSDAYQSGFLEGTVPTYEAYLKLKKSIAGVINKEAVNGVSQI